eukprot:134425-Chlamydomonas_euryale.AAC.2
MPDAQQLGGAEAHSTEFQYTAKASVWPQAGGETGKAGMALTEAGTTVARAGTSLAVAGTEMAKADMGWHRDGKSRYGLAQRWPKPIWAGTEMAKADMGWHRDGQS